MKKEMFRTVQFTNDEVIQIQAALTSRLRDTKYEPNNSTARRDMRAAIRLLGEAPLKEFDEGVS